MEIAREDIEKMREKWSEKLERKHQKDISDLHVLIFELEKDVRKISEQMEVVYAAHVKPKICSRCATINPGDANCCMFCGLILNKENTVDIGARLKHLLKKE